MPVAAAEGCTESHDTNVKESSASESVECLKNRKLVTISYYIVVFYLV